MALNILCGKQTIVLGASVANTFWLRLSGYMLRPKAHLPGILFESKSGIQTTFMRFHLDVVFIGPEDRIEKICLNVKPWRFLFAPASSQRVLEIPAGSLPPHLRVGDRLTIISA